MQSVTRIKMSSKNKQLLYNKSESHRNFKYEHGNVKMDMNLRVDIKDELKSAIIIAEVYMEDLKKALKAL